MNNYSEYEEVQSCLRQIEQKLKWGRPQDWHHDAFEELSQQIHQDTTILLSATTLKRVWGKVNYDSAPSISTLNTLAQFAGFDHWRDFKHRSTKSTLIAQKPTSRIRKLSNKGFIITSAAFLTILFISFYSLIIPATHSTTYIDYNNIQFSSQPLAEGIPNSVVFDFKLGATVSDSFFIQQYWDKTKTIRIDKSQGQATGIYYLPGYYKAKLIADTIIAKEHDLFIKSDGWLATIDYEPVPKYELPRNFSDDNLTLSDNLIDEIIQSESPIQSSYHIVDEFNGLEGDDFLLSAKVRHRYLEKWGTCQKLRVIVMGKDGVIIIPFSILGCASDLYLFANGNSVDGKQNDLSALCADFTDFQHIEIASIDGLLKITIGNEDRFELPMEKSIGELVGLRFRFIGVGEIVDLELKNSSDKVFINI